MKKPEIILNTTFLSKLNKSEGIKTNFGFVNEIHYQNSQKKVFFIINEAKNLIMPSYYFSVAFILSEMEMMNDLDLNVQGFVFLKKINDSQLESFLCDISGYNENIFQLTINEHFIFLKNDEDYSIGSQSIDLQRINPLLNPQIQTIMEYNRKYEKKIQTEIENKAYEILERTPRRLKKFDEDLEKAAEILIRDSIKNKTLFKEKSND
jgi:hypothetical protein